MTHYKARKGLIYQKTKTKTLIFDSEKSLLYTFNSTASFIFFELKKGKDAKLIEKNLAKNYRISAENASNDLNEFLRILLNKKIIEKT